MSFYSILPNVMLVMKIILFNRSSYDETWQNGCYKRQISNLKKKISSTPRQNGGCDENQKWRFVPKMARENDTSSSNTRLNYFIFKWKPLSRKEAYDRMWLFKNNLEVARENNLFLRNKRKITVLIIIPRGFF